MTTLTPGNTRPFYGWIIVAAIFLILGISVGSHQLIRLLIQIFAERFNASSGAVSFSTAGLLSLVAGIAAPFCGLLINRYSSRAVILGSLVLIGAGYIALAFVTQLWQVAAIYALAFSFGTYGLTIAGTTVVCEWFSVYRGRALGIAMSGMLLVGFILPPLAALSLENLGLRATFLIVAAMVLALLPVAFCLIVDRPAQKGLSPDGGKVKDPGQLPEQADSHTATLGELLANRRFWTVAIIIGICGIAINVPSTFFISLAEDAGISTLSASYLLSVIAALTLVGMLGFGRLSESINPRTSSLIAIGLAAAMCLILLAFVGYSAILTVAVMIGISTGLMGVLPAIMVATSLGQGSFALAFSILNAFTALTYSAALFLFGQTYDASDSARFGLQAILVGLVVAVVACRYLPGKADAPYTKLANAAPKD